MLNKAGLEESLKTLDTISDTLIYLSDTIDDFRDFFRPDKQKQSVVVSMLIERAINFSRPKLDVEHINITLTCKEKVNINTYVNELIQVLINIINNAADAIVEKQSATKKIAISCESHEKEVIIHIQDSGGGIDEAIIAKLFEPYFSTKEKNGTGLGLYMAQMIVESQLGGKIDVKNQNGGALFSLHLPYLKESNVSL